MQIYATNRLANLVQTVETVWNDIEVASLPRLPLGLEPGYEIKMENKNENKILFGEDRLLYDISLNLLQDFIWWKIKFGENLWPINIWWTFKFYENLW